MFKYYNHYINWINLCRAPAIENISFSSEANFQLSAGFGPNQVSTVLGMPLVIISLLKMFNLKFYSKSIFDYLFVAISLGLALLTFARGGVIAPVFTFYFPIHYFRTYKKIQS